MDINESYLNDFINRQINENLEMLSNFKEEDFYIFGGAELEEKLRTSTRYLFQIQDILLGRIKETK